MKFEKIESTFKPVAITLETQEEVDVLHALVGLASGGYANDLLYKIYNELDKISDSAKADYWSGNILPVK